MDLQQKFNKFDDEKKQLIRDIVNRYCQEIVDEYLGVNMYEIKLIIPDDYQGSIHDLIECTADTTAKGIDYFSRRCEW